MSEFLDKISNCLISSYVTFNKRKAQYWSNEDPEMRAAFFKMLDEDVAYSKQFGNLTKTDFYYMKYDNRDQWDEIYEKYIYYKRIYNLFDMRRNTKVPIEVAFAFNEIIQNLKNINPSNDKQIELIIENITHLRELIDNINPLVKSLRYDDLLTADMQMKLGQLEPMLEQFRYASEKFKTQYENYNPETMTTRFGLYETEVNTQVMERMLNEVIILEAKLKSMLGQVDRPKFEYENLFDDKKTEEGFQQFSPNQQETQELPDYYWNWTK